ncbi:hypothetical protein CsSME_00028975 [Camellia sinensis var. sinensis]
MEETNAKNNASTLKPGRESGLFIDSPLIFTPLGAI